MCCHFDLGSFITLASADLYSAAIGKDWGPGRELDATERGIRGIFALIDIVPGVKYVNKLTKIGKKSGATAMKTMIKESLVEGVEKGVKNYHN